MSNSLSNVVSNLVRAQMGSSVSDKVTDEELDRHVADLIIKEAKQKAEQYLKTGVRAFLPDSGPDANAPRTNKRFLSAIIRNTDEHNKAILKAQAEAAQEIKAEREELERQERRARAKEATDAERLRRSRGSSTRHRDDKWSRNDEDRRERSDHKRRHERDDDEEESHRHRRHRHRSRSASGERRDRDSDRHRRRKHHDDDDEVRENGSSKKRKPYDNEKDEGSSRRKERRSRSRDRENREHISREDREEGSLKRRRRHPNSRGSDLEPGRTRDRARKTEREEGLNAKPISKGKEAEAPRSRGVSANHSPEPRSPRTSAEPASKAGSSVEMEAKASSAADLSEQFRRREAALVSPPPPASPTLSEEEDIERLRPRRRKRASPRSRSPGPAAAETSKMDKYFDESYDPRLDVGPLSIPTVPRTGLIEGNEFERWEAMLDLIRQRREDKAERARMERLGTSKDKEKGKAGKSTEAWTMSEGVGVMDIQYKKRGSVREWDMGKEGF